MILQESTVDPPSRSFQPSFASDAFWFSSLARNAAEHEGAPTF